MHTKQDLPKTVLKVTEFLKKYRIYDGPTRITDGGCEWILEHCPFDPLDQHKGRPIVTLHSNLTLGFRCRDCGGSREWPELTTLIESRELPGILANQVRLEEVAWLWPGHIPLAEITFVDGDPGWGKSFLTIDIASRVSTGRDWPDGMRSDGPANVIMLNAEDSSGTTIVPRLRAANADLARIRILSDFGGEKGIIVPEGLSTLRDTIDHDGAKLVIFDPIVAFVDPRINLYHDAESRRLMALMKGTANETASAFVFVRHLNKGVASLNPLYRGGGSIGLVGASRAAYILGPDPTDRSDVNERRRVLAVNKFNLGPRPSSLAFTLVDTDHGQPRLEWEPEPVNITANAILNAAEGHGGERDGGDKTAAAERLLTDMLSMGWRVASDIDNAATEQGISLATLNRARKRLGTRSVQINPARPGAFWVLWLPSVVNGNFNGETFEPRKDPEVLRRLRERQGRQSLTRD
jgi:hypothetical protein